jgi:hypothetical protein
VRIISQPRRRISGTAPSSRTGKHGKSTQRTTCNRGIRTAALPDGQSAPSTTAFHERSVLDLLAAYNTSLWPGIVALWVASALACAWLVSSSCN